MILHKGKFIIIIIMQISISQHLNILFNSTDKQQRANSERLLTQLTPSPQFIGSLSNIIINTQNGQVRHFAAVYLKSLIRDISADPKILTSRLMQLLRQPLPTQIRKTIAESIGLILQKNDANNIIRGTLNNQVIAELYALETINSSMNLSEAEYIISLIQILITKNDGITLIFLDQILQKLLQIGQDLTKTYEQSMQVITILKMISQCFCIILQIEDLQENLTFQKLITNYKLQSFIDSILSYASSEKLLIMRTPSTYSAIEQTINQTKCNMLLVLSKSINGLIYLLNKTNFIAQVSPFLLKSNYYLQKCVLTLCSFLTDTFHYTQFGYQSVIRGINQMLKLCLVLIKRHEFYASFSRMMDQIILIISRIVELTPHQKDQVIQSPEQFVSLIKEIMEAGHKIQIELFFQKQNSSKYSTRVIAGRLLVQILCTVDGAVQKLFQQTCINVVHKPTIVDINLNQKCILLMGILCNCLGAHSNVVECVRQFINFNINSIYQANQPTKDHCVYLTMKLVFITLYHHLNYTPHPEQDGHCEDLFILVEAVFEGNFQPALTNPSIMFITYDLLRSLLQLDTTYITQYTQKLLNHFSSKLAKQEPSLTLLRSFQQLCTGNKALETFPDQLLGCVRSLMLRMHQEMKQKNINIALINQILQVVDTISCIKPVIHSSEWRQFFQQNLLSLISLDSPISFQDKVIKTIVRFIRQYHSVNTEEIRLIKLGVNYVKSNNKIGVFYDLISLIMVYGTQYFKTVPELSTIVVETLFTLLTLRENILPSETLKGVILISSLLRIARELGTITPKLLQFISGTLNSILSNSEPDSLVKSNVYAAFAEILCSELNHQLLIKVVQFSQIQNHSVMASKIMTIAFCDLIKSNKVNIGQLFKCALVCVMYICSHQTNVFKPDEEDDPEDYELQKQFLIQSIFDKQWLQVFTQTHALLASNPEIYKSILNSLDQFYKIALKKAVRLKYTPYGIRDIKKLK